MGHLEDMTGQIVLSIKIGFFKSFGHTKKGIKSYLLNGSGFINTLGYLKDAIKIRSNHCTVIYDEF